MEVAQLHVFLASFLLGEVGAEGVQFGFGWVALAGNVHLVVAAVDEVRSDRCGKPIWARRWRYESKADVSLQRVAVRAAGSRPGQLTIAVDGLAPPWPQIQLGVVVLKNQHDEAPKHAVLTLLQQSLTTKEICVLVETRRRWGIWKKGQTEQGAAALLTKLPIPS